MDDEKNPDERVSLHGHDPEDVLKALLKVDPAKPVPQDKALKDQGDKLSDEASESE
jgi:hypothetical protein